MIPKKSKNLDPYERHAYDEMIAWVSAIEKRPSLWSWASAGVQKRINGIIPNKIHKGITSTVKAMIKAMLTGSKFVSPKPQQHKHLKNAEDAVISRIKNHKHVAAAEGGITGAGGFLSSLADFPLLLSIKIKLLYDIAAMYGVDTKDLREKIFLLFILQVSFSSHKVRRETLHIIADFEQKKELLPDSINDIDWLTLQQQYRDYLDISKILQMIPIIGAAVGTVVNYRLVNHLGKNAMQCYRLRYFQNNQNLWNQNSQTAIT